LDKTAVIRLLIDAVEADLRAVLDSQRSTQEGAVHEEAKAEDDKDTRAIESQYLARGLAQRVEELQETIAKLGALKLRDFGEDDPIALSALVTVEDEDGARTRYLLVPAGGGRKIDVDGEIVVVVTPSSPVGRALLGKRRDDPLTIRTPSGTREGEIAGVL
jgi:transcription elongation GreA/GreB family factor